MINQLPNMRGTHPCGSHVDTRKLTRKKNLNHSRGATKYFNTYLWDCCHHQFQDFEASFFPVEYSFAQLLFVSEVFKVNFDWEWSFRCAVLQNIFIWFVGIVVIVDFKRTSVQKSNKNEIFVARVKKCKLSQFLHISRP